MWQQVMPGVWAGTLLDATLDHAAAQWLALCSGLGLAPEATALGVLTEFEVLRDFAALSPSGAAYVMRDDAQIMRRNGGNHAPAD